MASRQGGKKVTQEGMRVAYRLKGQHRELELSGCDLLVGPNGAGKSTLLQALQFALLGRIPGVGQRALTSLDPEGMITASVMVNDTTVTRTLTRGDKGEKWGITVAPAHGERTLAEKEARLQQLLGAAPLVLDFAAFAGQSGPEQRRTLLGLAGGAITQEIIAELCGDHWPAVSHLWHGDAEEFLASARSVAKQQVTECRAALAQLAAGIEAAQEYAAYTGPDAVAELQRAEAAWQAWTRRQALVAQRDRWAQSLGEEPVRPAPELLAQVQATYQRAAQMHNTAVALKVRDTADLEQLSVSHQCPIGDCRCPVEWGPQLTTLQAQSAVVAQARNETKQTLVGTETILRQLQAQEQTWQHWAELKRRLDSLEIPDAEEVAEPTELREKIAGARHLVNLQARGEKASKALEAATLLEGVVGEKSPLSERVLEAGLGTLTEHVNGVLQAFDVESEVRLAPLGWGDIPWDGLSSGERTVLALAVGVAMLDTVEPPLRLVLLDNVECLDPDRRRKVLDGLAEMRRMGMITHAVAAGVVTDQLGGWQVIEL